MFVEHKLGLAPMTLTCHRDRVHISVSVVQHDLPVSTIKSVYLI